MIRLEKLNKSYRMGKGALHVLKDLDMEIEAGELVSIMGSSGSGKSTLLNVLGLLDGYDSGGYYLEDQLMRDLSERQAAGYRNRFIGFVFQSFNLISFKNAVENVALPLYYQKVPRRRRNRIAMEYLERVGLTNWAEHLPSEMSGGQKQRVAIARALIGKPKLILADEPTGALDTDTGEEILRLLRSRCDAGAAGVLVTHEARHAAWADRVVFIRDGLVVDESGADTAEELLEVTP